jgi:hypothetical protein
MVVAFSEVCSALASFQQKFRNIQRTGTSAAHTTKHSVLSIARSNVSPESDTSTAQLTVYSDKAAEALTCGQRRNITPPPPHTHKHIALALH